MPYSNDWEANDLFLEHKGVLIYHVYKDNGPEETLYIFGTAADSSCEHDDTTFDGSKLIAYVDPEKEGPINDYRIWREAVRAAIKVAIIAAIDSGELAGFIEAATDRWKTSWPKEPEAEQPAELEAVSTVDLKTILVRVRQIAFRRICQLYQGYRRLGDGALSLGCYTVNYSSDAEFTITGLVMRTRGDEEILMVIKEEEDSIQEDDETFLVHMSTPVLVDLLEALEKTLRPEGQPQGGQAKLFVE